MEQKLGKHLIFQIYPIFTIKRNVNYNKLRTNAPKRGLLITGILPDPELGVAVFEWAATPVFFLIWGSFCGANCEGATTARGAPLPERNSTMANTKPSYAWARGKNTTSSRQKSQTPSKQQKLFCDGELYPRVVSPCGAFHPRASCTSGAADNSAGPTAAPRSSLPTAPAKGRPTGYDPQGRIRSCGASKLKLNAEDAGGLALEL